MTSTLPPTVPPNGTAGTISPDELGVLRAALATKPLPPYVLLWEPESDRDLVWTLQRATTPEGVEPGSWWPIYVDDDGRMVAGPAGPK